MMLTLTIDPELFPDPKAAYLHVRKERGISRLMRELDHGGHLHSRRYLYVVEFQRKTLQAHFHVLVDASRIPKAAVDQAWSRLRPSDAGPVQQNRPAFGMTRFSRRRFDGGAEHAARYATKYLVKTPVEGWPAWVLEMGADQRVPRFQSSRGFWKSAETEDHGQTIGVDTEMVGEGEEQFADEVSEDQAKQRRASKPYLDRVEACGSSCNLFEGREVVDFETGESSTRREWMSRLDLTEAELRAVADGSAKATVRAVDARGAVRAMQLAVGRPIGVVTGIGGKVAPDG